MKLGSMKQLVREQLDDTAAPYLWSNTELEAYFNEAEVEAAIRSRLLVDSTNAAVRQITVTANTREFPLDPRVFMVRRAKLASEPYPLTLIQQNTLDNEYAGWDATDGEGLPYDRYMVNGTTISLPEQDAETTLDMTVVREPLNAMNDDEDSPEIPSRYHIKLLEWVKYRCYMKPDTETRDPKAAAENYALFEAEFGPRRTATELQFELEHEGYDQENGAF
jgi:hypothetical protein